MAAKNLLVSVPATNDDSGSVVHNVEIQYKSEKGYNFDPVDDIETFELEDGETREETDEEFGEKQRNQGREKAINRQRTGGVNFNVIFDNEKVMPPNSRRYPNPYLSNAGLSEESVEFLNNEESSKKKMERAKRFGIQNDLVIDQQLDDKAIFTLYESFNIDPDNVKHKEKYRLNAVYVRGVNRFSTNEIFEYFSQYKPKFMEWINDTSCNVVWENKKGACCAMLNLSKPIKTLSKAFVEKEDGAEEDNPDFISPLKRQDIKENPFDDDQSMLSDDDDQNETVTVDASKHLVPPGIWRVGKKSDLSDLILMRFATVDDVKARNCERDSEYYRQHGNPNYGGLQGLISNTRKRRYQNSNFQRRTHDENFPMPGNSNRFLDDGDFREEDSYPDLRVKLKKATRWQEIKNSNRRPSDDENGNFSPYSDDENADDGSKRSGKTKKLRMQMRADDVERKTDSRQRQLASVRKHRRRNEEPKIEQFDDRQRRPQQTDMRERLKKFKMRITVNNDNFEAEDGQCSDSSD